jgi:diguanylate cyclase (GGDEF)-like protein/PAS domain S-box-containing protein
MFDMKTVIFEYAITSGLCVIVISALWFQNRHRFNGLDFWLAGFTVQFTASLFFIFYGIGHNLVLILAGNTLVILGMSLVYTGLERFVYRPRPQIYNYILPTVFFISYTYFTFLQPNILARNLIGSMAMFVIAAQCAWLVYTRVDVDTRYIITRRSGIIFISYCLVSTARILTDLSVHTTGGFVQSDGIDAIFLLAYQSLYILLTFDLFLMVNRRLVASMESDIENRARAEEKLRANEKKFRALFEQAAIGVAQIETLTGRFVTVNQRYCDIVGYSREEMLETSFQQITHPDDLQTDLGNMARLCQNEIREFSMEKRYVHKNGSAIWVSLTVSPLWQLGETPDFHIAVVEDITARKQIEEALRESEAIFSSFLENSPVYVFFKDKDIRTLRLSKNYEQMLGVSISEAIGKTMDDLFPSDLAKSMVADDLRILNEGKRVEVVEELNGHVYETTKFPIYKDGKPEMLAGFTLDITERKRAEEALRDQQIKFQTLIENVNEIFIRYDLDRRYQYVSPVIQNYLDMKPEDFIGKTHREAGFTEEQSKFFDHYLNQVIASGKPADVEFTLQGRGGQYALYTRIHPEFDQNGRVNSIVTVTSDITPRKRAEELLQRQYQYLTALQETTLELLSQFDLDTLLENIVRRAGALIGTESGFLDLVDPETNQLQPRIGLGMLVESLQHINQPGEGIAGTVWQTGKPLVINDYDHWEDRVKDFSTNRLGAIIGVPLLSENEVLGVLGLAYDIQSGKTFGKETVDILIQFARLVTIAIKNSHLFSSLLEVNGQLRIQLNENRELQSTLHELSIRDPLTGAFNRRYMEEAIKQECARAERENYPISIVILDLDHLKEINGKYGHITGGDQALRLLGEHLKSVCRVGDIVCRYGGDEFLIILHNARVDAAYQRVEQWRVTLTKTNIQYNDMTFNIAFSAGVAAFPAHGKSIEDILLAADYALYRAKEAGRNCVKIYGEK